jgi:hypothetical protein
MQTVTISAIHAQGIESARDQAVKKARESLTEPVVLSWRDDRTDTIAPEIPGAATPERWKDYGVANGGKLEVDVGGDYHFVVGEAADFKEPHSLFTNVKDAEGNTYLCITGACTEEDRRRINEGFGGYGGRGG